MNTQIQEKFMRGLSRHWAACVMAVTSAFCATTFAQDEESTIVSSYGAEAQVAPAVTTKIINLKLTFRSETGNYQHIMPAVQTLPTAVSATDNGPLLYHGGPVMTGLNIYSIFWEPSKLQSGTAASMPAPYISLVTRLAADYAGHSISSVNTQYYQTLNGVTTYVSGLLGVVGGTGSSLGTYVDTNPYPASACTPTAVNCLSDAQVEVEVARVMKLNNWTGGLNKIFMIYLLPGEGTCLAAGNCTPVFCGYHSHFTNSAGASVLYANMPYAVLSNCQHVGTPSPNNNAVADTEMSVAAHEISETVTDPLGNGWFSAQGNENGDLCAFQFGRNTFDPVSGGTVYQANQNWNGHYYELQMMYDNHYRTCSQFGP